jgi:hypothetical protein
MRYVVRCKGCREIIPAPVEILPTQSMAAQCPRCDGYWRYIPTQVSRWVDWDLSSGSWQGLSLLSASLKGLSHPSRPIRTPYAACRNPE